MAYQALYRKFRPRRFEDVVGQSHITTILKNQVASGRSAHAYLFCGSRGTGKTTTAKIFARAVNCLAPQDGEACGTCAACGMMEQEGVDIIEIDAASNNGVDDMRALIEQARFTPLQLNYKVYIIDEVHMLSNSASNALLKTLEEPPPHVKFLLATTEPQKLLPTVISRCQRYDFKRLAVKDIIGTLHSVLGHIGAHVQEAGLYTIARAADGGMRDALSMLDQCLAFCGNDVSEQDVCDVLGGMDSAFLFSFMDALAASRADTAIHMLDEVMRGGRNLAVFVQDVIQHMRALLLVQVCGHCIELLECTEETMAQYEKQAQSCPQVRLLRALEALWHTQSEMKWLSQPRILVETMLVRICRPEDENGVLALEDRITKLEALIGELQQGAPPWEKPAVAAALVAELEEAQGGQQAEDVPMEPPVGAMMQEQEPEAAEASKEGAVLWEQLRKQLQKKNAALYVLSDGAERVSLQGSRLTVYFPKAKREAVKVLGAPPKMKLLQEALGGMLEGAELRLQIQDAAAMVMEEEAQAKELMRMFGDKLSIEE